MIPYGRQIISDEDIEAVVQALKSPLITQGPAVEAFESAVADYCGASYAAAVNSGTAALHIACLALGIGAGDMVWTSPITFAASANCALYTGAEIDFVDVDPDTGNMSATALKNKLKTSSRLPKAVIVVHLAGMPADMEEIRQLSVEYSFRLIEDACHALGASYKGSRIGSCRFSDITVFSFHPVKAITTGEGGMAVTNDPYLHQRLKLFSSHGITRNPDLLENRLEGGWYYEQLELGFNYRMPDINAALGISQLRMLDDWIETRRKYADFYLKRLADADGIVLPPVPDDRSSAYHLFIVRVAPEKRRMIYDSLRDAGIGTNVHYIPVYHHPYYRKKGAYGPLENAENFYSQILTVPLCPAMTEKELEYVADRLIRICSIPILKT